MAPGEAAGWYVALAFEKMWDLRRQQEAVTGTEFLGPLGERSWELRLCPGRDLVS